MKKHLNSLWQVLCGLLVTLSAASGQTNVLLDTIGEGSSLRNNARHPVWATDGKFSSNKYWRTAEVSPSVAEHTLRWELDQSYAVDRLVFTTLGDDEPLGELPPDEVRLQTRDGGAWTDLQVWTGGSAGAFSGSFDETFGTALTGREIRLVFRGGGDQNVNGQFLVISEIELYGEAHPLQWNGGYPRADGFLVEPGDAITLDFSEAIAASDLGGIVLETADGSATVSGVSASVSGNQLQVAHPALTREQAYRLLVPSGTVVASSDGTTPNAPIEVPFTVAPPSPQLLEAPTTMADLQADLVFRYDRPLNAGDANAVSIWNITTQTAVGPLTLTVNGAEAVVGHPGLQQDHIYRVVLGEGTVTGQSNGAANAEYRGELLGGEYVLYSSSFTDGAQTNAETTFGSEVGAVAASSTSWQWSDWRAHTDDARPEDIRQLWGKRGPDDFAALPPMDLVQGESYSVRFAFARQKGGALGLYQNDTPSRTNAALLLEWEGATGGGMSRKIATGSWISDRDGPTVLLFSNTYTPDVNIQRDMLVDDLELVRNFPPALQVDHPVDGLTVNEGDPIQLEVDAFGISGELTRLLIEDGAIDENEVIVDTSNGRIDQEWLYDTPGSRTLTITAWDDRGESTTVTRDVTILLADGSDTPFQQWDFDDNEPQGVTTGGDFGADSLRTIGTNYLSTPSVFLFAGLTYTFQFDVTEVEEGGLWGFEALSEPGFPAETDPVSLLDLDSGGEGRYTVTFTVPEDGPYYLTLYSATGDNKRNWFDNLRVVGLSNSAPLVTLEKPALREITAVAGAGMTFEVTASDPDGTLDRVEFRNGDLVLGSAETPNADGRYVFTWDNVPFGTHHVRARAIDSSNGYADTEVVQLDARRDHLRISTLIGEAGVTERVYELEYQSDGTLLMAASLDPALLPGTPPVQYLNGTGSGDTGVLVVLDENGTTIENVLVLGTSEVVDLALDANDRIYAALGPDGYAVLDAGATTLLQAQSSFSGPEASSIVHRVDAAPGGTHAILVSSTADYLDNPRNAYGKVYDGNFQQLGDLTRIGTFVADLAVDEANEQVFFVGYKNIDTDDNPVDIPTFWARSYTAGTVNDLNFRGYDWGPNPGTTPDPTAYSDGTNTFAESYSGWETTAYQIGEHTSNPAATVDELLADAPDADSFTDGSGTSFLDAYSDWYATYDRWLNRLTNNMADTRGERVDVINGQVYASFEFDGGNTPLRWSTTDLEVAARDLVPKSDYWNQTSATSTVPKAYMGIFTTDGVHELGTWTIARLPDGSDNTVRMANGDFAVDEVGRIHTVASSAFGLPISVDHFPGGYTGGAYYLVYSPDMETREFVGRVSTSGTSHAVAVSPNGMTAIGGAVRSGGASFFERNAWDTTYSEASGSDFRDAYFAVGDFRPYFRFQIGEHPRLFFSAEDVPALRDKLNREPFASMRTRLEAMLTEQNELEDEAETYRASYRAMIHGFLYQLTGDETHAQSARDEVAFVVETPGPGFAWADSSTKGLRLYQMAVRVAAAYDWCANSEAWDESFVYTISKALLDQAEVIIENGGSEQNSSPASNWQGARGSAGGLALLATDHEYAADLLDRGHRKAVAYLDANLGNDATTQGWTPEGLGYFGYPMGDFVGPYGVAMARHDPTADLRDHIGLSRSFASIFTNFSKALNVLDYGGMKLDWADDHTHTRGNGAFNLAFHYADPDLIPGIKYWYDRTHGTVETDRARWDELRGGTIWGYLFYPEDVTAVNPLEILEYVETFHDDGSQGIGMFTFREEFHDGNDNLAQFNARTRYPGGHNGPDGLGFRILAEGNPFVVGGGRAAPGRIHGQTTLYPVEPFVGNVMENVNTGEIEDAVVKTEGGGHVIAWMDRNNVGVFNHRRWFVADYEETATGADATFVIADTSDDGQYFQLATYLENSVTINGQQATITGPNGAVMEMRVLYPSTATLTTGVVGRGGLTAFEEIFTLGNGVRIAQKDDPGVDPVVENRRILVEGDGSGEFMVVLTVQGPGGAAHPAVQHTGAVAGSTVTVGSRSYDLQTDGILYDGQPYGHPDATVTFALGSHGSQASGDTTPLVQTVARGGAASAPAVTVDPGYLFLGWDKAFDPVARSMTVSAQYEALESIPTAPGILVATATGGSTATLTWEDRSNAETGHEIQRQEDGGTWATVATIAADIEQFDDSGLTPLTLYHYRVRALGTGGNSPWAGPVSTTTGEPNAAPVFNSQPVQQAHQEAPYQYAIFYEDADADPVTVTAPTLPDWLTLTPVGSGQAILSGMPTARDLAPANVVVQLEDGFNPAVQQSFTIEVNAGPVLSLSEPGSTEVYLADARHGLVLEAGASDPDGVASTTWSQVNQVGQALFDDAASLSTAVFFDAAGDYTLRLTASDGQAGNHLDLVVHVGTPLQTETLQAVNLGGNDYVAGSNVDVRDGNPGETVLDLDGDGQPDDAKIHYSFSDSSPLHPGGSGYDDTQPSAVFYGGIVGEQLDKTSGHFGDETFEDKDPDLLKIRYQPGNGQQGLLDALLYWKKEDFLGGADSRELILNADSEFQFPGAVTVNGVGRWMVRSGDQFYVSDTTFSSGSPATLTLGGNLLMDTLWAPYNPQPIDLDFDQANADFSTPTAELENITAVGFLADDDTRMPVDLNSAMYVELDAFSVKLGAVLETNTAPVLDGTLIASDSYTIAEAVPVAATVLDDGLPADPGSLVLQWTTHYGPESGQWTNPGSADASVQFDTAGVYVLQLAVDDGEVISLRRETVEMVGNPFTVWMDQYTELSTAQREADADPNADGIPNVVAFLHDLSPVGDAGDRAALGRLFHDHPAAPGQLLFEFRRRDGAASHGAGSGSVEEVGYQLQWSHDLAAWNTGSWSFVGETTAGDGSIWVRMVLPETLLESGPVFVRMRVDP